MKEHATYRIEGYCNPDNIGEGGDCNNGYDCYSTADTLKEAKQKAKDMLGVPYQEASEPAMPLKLCRIMRVLGGDERDDIVVYEESTGARKFRFNPCKHSDDYDESPTNEARTIHAEAALDAFLISTGESRNVDEDAVRDLMADLLHYCDKFGHEGAKILARAERDWLAER